MKWRQGVAVGALMAGLFVGQALADVQAVYEGKPHDALFAIQRSEQGLVAVGAAGQYSRSADGRNWVEERIADPTVSLLSISEYQGNGIAVGQSGVIMRRNQSDWLQVTSPSSERLMAVAQTDGGLALAVGGFGTVLRSKDAGKSWEKLSPDWQTLIQQPYEPHVYNVMFNARGDAFIVGEFGMIARSENGGDSWSAVHASDESLFGIDMNSSGKGMAVGQSGLVLVSNDFGLHWEAVDSGTEAILLDVAVRSDGAAVAGGIREALRFSAGADKPQRLAVAPFLESWFADIAILKEEFYLVGQRAQIIKIRP